MPNNANHLIIVLNIIIPTGEWNSAHAYRCINIRCWDWSGELEGNIAGDFFILTGYHWWWHTVEHVARTVENLLEDSLGPHERWWRRGGEGSEVAFTCLMRLFFFSPFFLFFTPQEISEILKHSVFNPNYLLLSILVHCDSDAEQLNVSSMPPIFHWIRPKSRD